MQELNEENDGGHDHSFEKRKQPSDLFPSPPKDDKPTALQ